MDVETAILIPMFIKFPKVFFSVCNSRRGLIEILKSEKSSMFISALSLIKADFINAYSVRNLCTIYGNEASCNLT